MCDICASEWKLGITNSVDILISYAPRYYLEFARNFREGALDFLSSLTCTRSMDFYFLKFPF